MRNTSIEARLVSSRAQKPIDESGCIYICCLDADSMMMTLSKQPASCHGAISSIGAAERFGSGKNRAERESRYRSALLRAVDAMRAPSSGSSYVLTISTVLSHFASSHVDVPRARGVPSKESAPALSRAARDRSRARARCSWL